VVAPPRFRESPAGAKTPRGRPDRGAKRERDPQAARRAPRKTRASTACRIARAPPAIAALTRSASSEPAPSSDQFTRSQGRAWVVTAVAMATAHVHRSAPRRSGRPSSAPWSGRRPSGHLQSGGVAREPRDSGLTGSTPHDPLLARKRPTASANSPPAALRRSSGRLSGPLAKTHGHVPPWRPAEESPHRRPAWHTV
jgi:hypothetical protein